MPPLGWPTGRSSDTLLAGAWATGGLHIPIWRLAGHPSPRMSGQEYRTLFPEPVTWKGWWDDEDSSEMLNMGTSG